MEKLAAYSDDEEETTSVAKAEKNAALKGAGDKEVVDTALKEASSRAAEEEDPNANLHPNGDSDGSSSKIKNAVRAGPASSPFATQESSMYHQFAPVPKVMKSNTPGQDASNGSSSKAVIDAEWGLGIEKPVTGEIDEALFAKLAHFHTLKEEQGTHFNQSLAKNRSFRNPHIFDKLVQWVEVEETASGYKDMIKGKARADDIWMSSKEARAELKVQGGKYAISTLQKRRQEESDERKRKSRRDNIDFVGGTTKTASPKPTTNSRSKSEAMALAESRAQKIRDEMAARSSRGSGSGGHSSNRDGDRDGHKYRERDRDRDRDRHRHRDGH